MDKLERLACLYITFLNHPEGIGFSEIRRQMSTAYEGDSESARRKFERDKEDLRGLGMDLQYVPDGSVLPSGAIATGNLYIPRDELPFSPAPSLTEQQSRNLATVLLGSLDSLAARDEERAGRVVSAAMKLLYRHPGAVSNPRPRTGNVIPLSPNEEEDSSLLGSVHEAILKRAILSFRYPDPEGRLHERKVEGRGLIAHRGRWCLVAFCRRAGDIRSFYIDRMIGPIERVGEFLPDRSFNIKEHSLHPLALHHHPPLTVSLQPLEDQEELLHDFLIGLPDHLRIARKEAGEGVVHFKTTNLRALFSWLVTHPGVILRMGPEDLRRRFREFLEQMRRLYLPGGAGEPVTKQRRDGVP